MRQQSRILMLLAVAVAGRPARADGGAAAFEMPQLQRPVFPAKVYCIAACHAAGGGTVRVPEGVWLTGSVHLKSNVRFEVVDEVPQSMCTLSICPSACAVLVAAE